MSTTMRIFKLEIEMVNDAFADLGGAPEIERILREVAVRVSKLDFRIYRAAEGAIMDANGNCVGGWKVDEEAPL